MHNRKLCIVFYFLSSIFFNSLYFNAYCGVSGKNHNGGPDYSIARWRGFKNAAYSITFDDNYRFQVTYATPVLNQHNYKATFFIVTNRVGQGWAPGWDTVNMLADQGHEIASHSKNHANFVTLSQHPEWADSMVHEFRDSRDTINVRVPSRHCETFAWPGGAVNQPSANVSKNFYMACRGSDNGFENPVPFDFYNISSQYIYHNTLLETVNGYIDTVLSVRGWLVERWHGFQVGNDTNGYEPVPITIFINHMNHVALHEDSLWITTVDSVVKYIRERESSIIALVDSSGNTVQFCLTNELPDSVYDYSIPLSIKLRIYGKMSAVCLITQAGSILPFTITQENGYDYLNFEAIPNKGLIELQLPSTGIAGMNIFQQKALNYPNPFSISTTISFFTDKSQHTDLLIFNCSGSQVKAYSNFFIKGWSRIEFEGSELAPGIYNCLIRNSERTLELRMIKR